jgi:GTP cyclohydrolase II
MVRTAADAGEAKVLDDRAIRPPYIKMRPAPRALAHPTDRAGKHSAIGMTQDQYDPDPGTRDRLVAVDRASFELRRGRLVLVTDPGGGDMLAGAAELAGEPMIERLRALAGRAPDLALTHHRARTLKIRLYTDDVVLVPFPSWLTAGTARSLADPTTDLDYPLRGPFVARREPVTAAAVAAVRLAKIARLLPSVVVLPAPAGFDAAAEGIAAVAAADALDYEIDAAGALRQVTAARVPLADAENARLLAFRSPDGGREHLAVVIGDPPADRPVLTRLHSECFTGDLIGSLKCDCGQQLRGAVAQIAAEGAGILLYLRQEGRGIGLINKLRAYALQDQGFDTVEANQRIGFESDERVFLPAARILRLLGFRQVRLMTNNPDKVVALERYGIEVVQRVTHAFPSNDHNAFYLSTKKEKSGHLL